MIVDRRRAGHADASELDAVLWQLPPSEIEELPRRSAVTREVAMQCARGAIPRLTDIANQDAATAASEHQRRAETRRPASDDDDVVHLEPSHCKTISTT